MNRKTGPAAGTPPDNTKEADTMKNNGLNDNFFRNAVAHAKALNDTDLYNEYMECYDRPEPTAIANMAIYKMEMIERESKEARK